MTFEARRRWLVVTMLAVVAAMSLSVAAQQGSQGLQAQFERARLLEENSKTLNEAIALYKQVAAQAGANRALAAQALLRAAAGHQKLGDAEAKTIYERIVSEFPDRKAEVALARARLSGTAPVRGGADAESQLTTRRVLSQYAMFWEPSPDGRYLTFTNLNNLFVRDLASGDVRQLTRGGVGATPARGPEYPENARFSSNGRQLAYGWKTPAGYQLRMIQLDGSDERTITKNPEHEWIGPAAWSPDGARVLAKINSRGNAGQIAWVLLRDGGVQVLKTAPWTALGRVALSPDGRYIAYDQRSEERPAARTIFVLSADGSKQVAVTDGSSRDEVIGWLPDGGALAFATYRSGSPDLWLLPLKDGVVAGTATLVKRDLRAFQPLGLTKNGSLFYTQVVTTGDAYVASVDWDAGRVNDVQKINTNLTADFGAAWSPDGSQIAYVAHRGTELQRRVIAVHTIKDGSTREVVPTDDLTIQTTGGHQWSADGTAYLVNAASPTHRWATFSIDLRTGRPRTLAAFTNGYAQIPQWLNGGRSLLYVFRDQFKPTARIVVRDVESGTERDVPHGFESEPGAVVLASPDERTLVFVAGSQGRPPDALRLMSLAGGAPRILLEAPGELLSPVVWTPDSRRLVYARRTPTVTPPAPGARPESSWWVVDVNTGESRQLNFPPPAPAGFAIHPEGRRITYTRSNDQIEVWTMDRLSSSMTTSR